MEILSVFVQKKKCVLKFCNHYLVGQIAFQNISSGALLVYLENIPVMIIFERILVNIIVTTDDLVCLGKN